MLTGGFARKPLIWVLGNHPPRRCGIATFTSDLADAVEANGTLCRVAAMDDGSNLVFPERVEIVIGQEDLAAYIEAADQINRSKASAIFIQHEFGIFGGENGSHVVTLLRFLEIPVVTTLHTVLDKPNETQRWITEEILSKSEVVVVMSQKAKEILRRCYGRDDNVVVIPHGVPGSLSMGRSSAKRELGWEGRTVILTFGLLSPDKGIETMIRAMARIKQEHPDALYVVAGQSHPHIIRTQGEAYRESLERLTTELGLSDSIQFINRFTELNELCLMITACDLYATPYLKMEQITSGTLSYAVGLGRCVVSTPYWHAEELLSQGPGRLVDVRSVEGFADTICELLNDDDARHLHEAEARRIGQAVRWPRIGAEYLRLVADIWKPVYLPVPNSGSALQMPSIQHSIGLHLESMTDAVSLFQHAVYDIPNRNEGYCTDDAARALPVLWDSPSMAFAPETKDRLERTYLSFTAHAWNPDRRLFRNFMAYDRRWLDDGGSLDCQGRTLLTLAKGVSLASSDSRRTMCLELFRVAWPEKAFLECARYCAQALKAAVVWLRQVEKSAVVERSALEMASRLLRFLDRESGPDWVWFEPALTYDNARLPEALLEWADFTGDAKLRDRALESLSWLCACQQKDGCFLPIGSDGFWKRGGQRATFDQQPIEAWATVDACLCAFQVTGNLSWLEQAELAFKWFYGRNVLGALMIDAETGACCDGLERHGTNANKGAESCLAFLGSTFAIHRARDLADSPARSTAVL